MKTSERREIARAVLNAPSYKAEQQVIGQARVVDILPTIPAGTYLLVPKTSNWESEDIDDYLAVARQPGAVWDTRGRECLISENQIPGAVKQLLGAGFLPAIGFPRQESNDQALDEVEDLFDAFRKGDEGFATVARGDKTV